MTMRPGYGLEFLHLGQTAAELRNRFGAPARRRKSGALREYWLYPNFGFECIVSRRSRRVLSLFLHQAATGSDSILDSEASSPFHLNIEGVRSRFGAPNLEGGGFTMTDGTWIGRWFSYDIGLGFHFDQGERVETVSIFARKRAVRAKAASLSAGASTSRIAALRRT